MRHVRISRERGAKQETAEAVFFAPREAEVLLLVCEGKSNKEIATALRVSAGTAKAYVANLLRGLWLHSRCELIIWVFQHIGRPGDPQADAWFRDAINQIGTGLHAAGCSCPSIYCSAMRVARRSLKRSVA